MKQIPSVLERPVAISESYDNTVMVFGRVFDAKRNPIVIALRVNSTNRRNHVTLVNKIRSVGTRSHNLDKLLSKDSLLYLSKNKKETVAWFNALGRSTPFGGTKFGLIRSISFQAENSNRKIKTSAVVRNDTVAPIEKRLRGDALLDAQDLIDTVMDIGGEVERNDIGEDGFHYFEAFFEKFRWRVLSGDAVRRIKRTEKPHTVSDKCEKEELLPVRALPPMKEALKMAEALLKIIYTLPGQKVKR